MPNYNIPFSPPDITEAEIAEVADTLRSGWITTGPKTKELERRLSQYTQTPKTVCLNSATAALELILRVLEVGPGDEVIVPAMTYTASCSVITHVGATPVMVDIQADTFEMDYDLLEQAITEKTKVIIPVELAGVVCDYDRLFQVVEKKRDLFTASSKWQKAFSFHADKNFTTAEGGSATWKTNPAIDDEEMYKEFQILSLHGQTKDALAKMQLGSWEYDIVTPAYKCNMTDIMASLGLVQLDRYPSLLQRRKDIVDRYNRGFAGSRIRPLAHKTETVESSRHLYITHVEGASLEERNLIIQELAKAGIASNVHYKPLPLLTAYKNLGFDMANYPKAYAFFENEITLPLHTKLSDEEVDYIIETFKTVSEKVLTSSKK